jgi:hypothetical protein
MVVIALFGLFLEAYMHNFNIVYIVFFFVFALAFSAGPIGISNLSAIEMRFVGCTRVFAGEGGECTVTLHNTGRRTAWALRLYAGEEMVEIAKLPPGVPYTATLKCRAVSRGRSAFSDCRVESLFPLSTVRFILHMKDRCEYIVYPEPKGISLEAYRSKMATGTSEEGDFEGLIRYDGTQSLSRIYWPSMVMEELQSKRFEHLSKSDKPHFTLSRQEDIEKELSQLTLWVVECEKIGIDFTLEMDGRIMESDKEGIDGILESLALYR